MTENEPRWLDNAQQAAWRKLVTLIELLPGALETQLRRDAGLSHFEYFVLAMLSESPGKSLRMTALAAQTNATLARLSHVVSRLESRGYVERTPCPEDRRATNATLTPSGWDKIVATAPGHAATVLAEVFEPLDAQDVADLDRVIGKILKR